MDGDVETFLYRHFGGDGALLYVGISLSAVSRLAQHYEGSHWSSAIRQVQVEAFPNRSAAMVAEKKAILAERPQHNVRHQRDVVEEARLESRSAADRSRSNLLQQLVQFAVVYTVKEVAEVLGMSASAVRWSIEAGRLGSIELPAKPGTSAHGTPFRPIVVVTGWQIIDWLEALQRKRATRNVG